MSKFKRITLKILGQEFCYKVDNLSKSFWRSPHSWEIDTWEGWVSGLQEQADEWSTSGDCPYRYERDNWSELGTNQKAVYIFLQVVTDLEDLVQVEKDSDGIWSAV